MRGATPTLHELVHIEAPNGSRFLAEGLALYALTPFRPGKRIVISPKRYRGVYGKGLTVLGREWHQRIKR